MTAIGQFRKYDHLERLGHPEVRDVDVGTVHVFPKLDGTNASVWVDGEGKVQAGSRNRVLSIEADNAGFCAWVHSDDVRAVALREVLLAHPDLVIYGEWLVPHALKTYRDDAWRRFWVFDVYSHVKEQYLEFDAYAPMLEGAGLDVIHPLCTADNPSDNQLREIAERNTWLMKDGEGCGEGVVIKNYKWANKFGRQPWAKLVTNEFKEKAGRVHGAPHVKGERVVEQEIVDELATAEFVRKEFAKVVHAVAGDQLAFLYTYEPPGREEFDTYTTCERYAEFVQANRHKIIPRFLGTLFYTFVTEEIRTVIKKWKNPVVDFSKLNKLLTIRAKAIMVEVF